MGVRKARRELDEASQRGRVMSEGKSRSEGGDPGARGRRATLSPRRNARGRKFANQEVPRRNTGAASRKGSTSRTCFYRASLHVIDEVEAVSRGV